MSFSPIVACNQCQRGLKLDARGRQTAEGFAVLKGSVISPGENSKVISPVASRRRKEARIEGNALQEGLLSGTPSAAASSVIGNSANGWVEWKAGDGRTLKELEQAE